VPPQVRDYFKAINIQGNPYKLPQDERGKWAEGLDVEPYAGQEYLFYVGCVGSYDERGKKMAQSVALLLGNLGVTFGILGSREFCDGNEVRSMGERGLFEHIAKQNIEQFKDLGVKKMITLSPHAYNAIRNDYPELGGDFDVYHYSQILKQMLKNAELKASGRPLRVTFHDPCYLGRHNKEFNSPRKVLLSLPDVEFIEMDRSRDNALCCGGGGGNFFTDILGPGSDSPARARVREALDTGAEVIAVACPNCAKMLEDAIKTEDIEDSIRVMDLAEIVLTRCD